METSWRSVASQSALVLCAKTNPNTETHFRANIPGIPHSFNVSHQPLFCSFCARAQYVLSGPKWQGARKMLLQNRRVNDRYLKTRTFRAPI